MADIGHNQPPGQIEFSAETVKALNEWMNEHPTIDNEDMAREAKLLTDRSSACMKDLDDERQSLTKPLNERITKINDQYREPKNLLARVHVELQARINAFLLREEQRRKAIAEEAQRRAEEAERVARLAEEAERNAKAEAEQGVCDVDIAGATGAADEAFSAYKTAAQEARRAERDAHVKVGGGFRRATSLRTKNTFVLVDINAAIQELGGNEQVQAAILVAARAYYRFHNRLPAGIQIESERG